MSGKHSAQTDTDTGRGSLRRWTPAIAGTAVTMVLAAGAAAMTLTGDTPDDSPSQTIAGPTDLITPDRSPDRADRDRARMSTLPTPVPGLTSPSPSPSKTSGATPTRKTATPGNTNASTGSVSTSGTCKASYYASGQTTANGESFNPDGYTAAHRSLAFNTRVRVTNTANGSSVVVRINDRGPFVNDRCLDLARGAFSAIASLNSGVVTVRYEVLS